MVEFDCIPFGVKKIAWCI
ncbi:Protein of unknown function [Pyronema omphalodes CBS 100304]|uniref:Uncharacterized protein n=1 Tax=Pyronema omphalodes (strain CBS 100304) TaxID=1076935 RepID=U4LM16_PYROM|nr:Protein of unknown function [Pyronema omphalodes CBS 100304]